MFLLDTNVVSEFRKIGGGKADRNVADWSAGLRPSDLYLSVITIHELEIGLRLITRRDAAQGAILRTWVESYVLKVFDGRILPVDTAIALRSAQLHVPDPFPLADGLIAATALVHGMTVVTRNVSDFAATGVTVLNPWAAV
jgi:predicted nucleic acid-binding protein